MQQSEDQDFASDQKDQESDRVEFGRKAPLAEWPVTQKSPAAALRPLGMNPSPAEIAKDKPKPEKRDWQPIDLTKGPVKKGLWDRTAQGFEMHVRQDLRKDLGTMLGASQREEVSKMIASKRHGGLRSGEVKKGLDKMVKEGKISKFEAKKLRREFGANKSSSIF